MSEVINKLKLDLKPLLFVMLFMASLGCKAQPASTVIKVVNGQVFTKQSTVKYRVISSQTVYYYVGLEKYIDGRWQEIVLDISSKAPSKAAVLKKAVSGKIANNEYDIKAMPVEYLINKNQLRLKLIYGASPAMVNKVAVSTEFTVNNSSM